MPAISSDPQPLYRIDECSDLMADACVCGDQGDLIFLSVWARDTAIQQFIGRLTLGRSEDGLDQFHVVTDQGGSLPVFVGSVERLEKRLTRSYRRTLFGSMVNLWLFDRRCIRPDKSSASALALLREREMLCSLRMALGLLQGFRLAIDVPALTEALGDLIRQGVLTAYPYPARIWTPEVESV